MDVEKTCAKGEPVAVWTARRSGADDFGVGGTVNFLKKGIQSKRNFGFQGSQSLRS